MKINYLWFTQRPNERYHCALFLHYLSLFLRSFLSVPLMALISNSPLFQPLSHYCSLPWHYVEQGWSRRKRVNLCIGRRGKKVSCGQINKKQMNINRKPICRAKISEIFAPVFPCVCPRFSVLCNENALCPTDIWWCFCFLCVLFKPIVVPLFLKLWVYKLK